MLWRGEGGRKVDAQLDRRVMEQVTGRFTNVGLLGEIMGGRQSRNRLDRTRRMRCKRDWPHKLGEEGGKEQDGSALRIYERHKRIQDIMNGETGVGSCREVTGREGNKGGRLLREIFIVRDISQLHLLTVYEGNSGERGGRKFPPRNFLLDASSFQLEFQLSLNITVEIMLEKIKNKKRKKKEQKRKKF